MCLLPYNKFEAKTGKQEITHIASPVKHEVNVFVEHFRRNLKKGERLSDQQLKNSVGGQQKVRHRRKDLVHILNDVTKL